MMPQEREKKLITRACDSCRKKKIRCEPISDRCVQCIKSKSTCQFTPISVPINRRRISRNTGKRVEELEKKLAWMEGQLKLSLEERQFPGLDQNGRDITALDEIQPTYTTSQVSGKNSLSSELPDIEGSGPALQISDMATASQQMLITGPSDPGIYHNTNYVTNNQPIFQTLPSKEKALHLITIYFSGMNTIHPLFDHSTFLSKFHSTYPTANSNSTITNDPSWYAALNVVFALSYQSRDLLESDTDPDPDDEIEAWGYFQNALSATSHLLTLEKGFTLSSVQALLAMAMCVTGLPNRGPATLLISSAIKIAQSLGMHRKSQPPSLLSVEEEAERRRVFWVGYALDVDISLRTRVPPTQNDEDMDISPPSLADYVVEYALGLGICINYELFYYRIQLALIQGEVYKHLLSVKAGKSSVYERAFAAEELEERLQTWRRSVPIELFCEYPAPLGPSSSSSSPAFDLSDTSSNCQPRHPVYLQLLCFQTLAVIRESIPIFDGKQEEMRDIREIEASHIKVHVLSAKVVYPDEARSAIHLFHVTPKRRLACIWTTLHIFTSATTTLLQHTLAHPSHPLSSSDLQALVPFLNLLGVFARTSPSNTGASNHGGEGGRFGLGKMNEGVEETYRESVVLFERARMAVEYAHSQFGPGSGSLVSKTAKTGRYEYQLRYGVGSEKERRYPVKGAGAGAGAVPKEKESIQDFLTRIERISSGSDLDDNGTLMLSGGLVSEDGWQ